MPLPLILGIGAAIAGVAGVGSGISGAVKMKDAKDSLEAAQWYHEKNREKLEEKTNHTEKIMEELGKLEVDITLSFKTFSDLIEKIHNKPTFGKIDCNGVQLPEYSPSDLKTAWVGLESAISCVAAGGTSVFSGIAAAGATNMGVMMLGTASTGTAISTLSGAAATNATLAALGGGSLAAGGGGMALGSAILGGTTLGVGLLVGGLILEARGSKISEQADKAWEEVWGAEKKINEICDFLDEIEEAVGGFHNQLARVSSIYSDKLRQLSYIVNVLRKKDWNYFTEEEQLVVENTTDLVGLLFHMCKINLVTQANNEQECGKVNRKEIDQMIENSENFICVME